MTDHERYAKWSPAKKVTYEKEGTAEKRSKGAIRVFHTGIAGRTKIREEVIGWDPPNSMTYQLLANWPIKNYQSNMQLEEKGKDSTLLTWKSTWENRLPKWIDKNFIARGINRSLTKFAKGIKADAENTPHHLLNPKNIAAPAANYSLGVASSDATHQLFTSGIVPIKTDGSVPKDCGEQCEVIWSAILQILNEANMKTTDIVSMTTYVVEKESKHLDKIMSIRDKVMDGHLPASTLVIVPRLANKKWKLEISVIASR